ncbi:hypothetical protein H920_01104 [Fukomys damarensis]|uniref:Uncharacterized protein n=1 Tax=Fukomys damarensis TaxID=885580 RepID=A0A091E4I2_FUKDA|nr:hypothetical protein H920_01104 [Fukomys damarensis]
MGLDDSDLATVTSPLDSRLPAVHTVSPSKVTLEAPMSTRECTRHGNTGLAPSRKSPALVRSSPRVRLGDPLPPLALHGQGCEFQGPFSHTPLTLVPQDIVPDTAYGTLYLAGSRNSSSLSLLEDANFQEALQDCSSARHHSSHTPVRSSGGAGPDPQDPLGP